jgi:hypothetical protein
MKQRNRVKHDKTILERLFAEALRLIREAAIPPSEALLMCQVSQLEETSRAEKWLASLELRRPT